MPARPATAATPLFAALLDPACYPHPVLRVEVLETHISWVLLTGEFAYKIKKPVYLGFVDFTTLGLRGHYCREELRLNRRLATGLYLDVVEIRGSAQAPRVGGEGRLIDCAVKMREFPQEALAGRALARGAFGPAEIDALAVLIAAFHAGSPAAGKRDRFGAPEAVLAAALQNFEQMLPLVTTAADDRALRTLRLWTEREFDARRQAFAARRRGGFVRECHGDLHLGNIAMIDDKPVPFDCIEFNDDFRWIDVMSEVAFLAMDLEDRGRDDLGWRFLNRYLEAGGDYGGLPVFRFYTVYRALVRAKVHLLRSRQPGARGATRSRLRLAFGRYLRLAWRLANAHAPALLITHGLSGSGKTTSSGRVIEALGAVRVRSDVERKRLHGLGPLDRGTAVPGAGIYGKDANDATYRRLLQVAETVLDAGRSAVVDAAFLRRGERNACRDLASRRGAPFLILEFEAPGAVLRDRVRRRARAGRDASDAGLTVLQRQRRTRERLAPDEARAAVRVDAATMESRTGWRKTLREIRRRIARAARRSGHRDTR